MDISTTSHVVHAPEETEEASNCNEHRRGWVHNVDTSLHVSYQVV